MDKAVDVAALRKKLDWKQGEMAEYLGVHRTTVLRIEKGELEPNKSVKRLLEQLVETARRNGHSKRSGRQAVS